jgi:ribose transport system permease protein
MNPVESDQTSGAPAGADGLFGLRRPGGGGTTGVSSGIRGLSRNQGISMLVILVVMWAVLGLLSPYFFTVDNLFEITLQMAVIGIIAAGETFVILSGGIDLSVGSVFACSAVVGGLVFESTGNLPLALTATVCFGALLGLIDGLLITKLLVPPFIATLGMMGVARGLALILSGGVPIYGLDQRYRFIGQGKLFDVIPVPTVIVLVVFILGFIIANYSRFGRFIYAIGSNTEAARLSGIKVARVTVGVYVISGLLCGLASIIEAGRLGIVQPAGGNGYELLAIGAVVVGGASLFGGEGSIIATLIGAIIVTTIRNGLNILGVNAFWQYVVNGMVIIAAVAADQYRRRR